MLTVAGASSGLSVPASTDELYFPVHNCYSDMICPFDVEGNCALERFECDKRLVSVQLCLAICYYNTSPWFDLIALATAIHHESAS